MKNNPLDTRFLFVTKNRKWSEFLIWSWILIKKSTLRLWSQPNRFRISIDICTGSKISGKEWYSSNCRAPTTKSRFDCLTTESFVENLNDAVDLVWQWKDMTFYHVDNSMTTIDFDWLVLNHAVQGRKASVTYGGPYPSYPGWHIPAKTL